MCQPKRLRRPEMPSPATKQAEALADVERVAQATYEAVREQRGLGHGLPWEEIGERMQVFWRAVVTDLLHRDVIKVGRRPEPVEQLAGQVTIDDQLDEIELRAQGRD